MGKSDELWVHSRANSRVGAAPGCPAQEAMRDIGGRASATEGQRLGAAVVPSGNRRRGAAKGPSIPQCSGCSQGPSCVLVPFSYLTILHALRAISTVKGRNNKTLKDTDDKVGSPGGTQDTEPQSHQLHTGPLGSGGTVLKELSVVTRKERVCLHISAPFSVGVQRVPPLSLGCSLTPWK